MHWLTYVSWASYICYSCLSQHIPQTVRTKQCQNQKHWLEQAVAFGSSFQNSQIFISFQTLFDHNFMFYAPTWWNSPWYTHSFYSWCFKMQTKNLPCMIFPILHSPSFWAICFSDANFYYGSWFMHMLYQTWSKHLKIHIVKI
jgi:hypothetical protein